MSTGIPMEHHNGLRKIGQRRATEKTNVELDVSRTTHVVHGCKREVQHTGQSKGMQLAVMTVVEL